MTKPRQQRHSSALFQDSAQHGDGDYDLVCFSHLRWSFVYQRPQHLLSRWARERRVFYVEEPVYGAAEPHLEVSAPQDQLLVVVPHLPEGAAGTNGEELERSLLRAFFASQRAGRTVVWLYTPMAVSLARDLKALLTVWDCMDELSAFAGAPRELKDRERELYDTADLIFTGGRSLFEAKRERHPHVHLFPSSVDAPHFERARVSQEDPADQARIPRPRLGFFGVIDERMDLELLREAARHLGDWNFVLLGPVVKIDPARLPQDPNIHYLGQKGYEDLPRYIAGWDVAMLPFARNESTRFISPTKIPEYLAAGCPVVSTSIADVVAPYGELGLVDIADDPREFARAVRASAARRGDPDFMRQVDEQVAAMSWERTWNGMRELVEAALAAKETRRIEDGFSPAIVDGAGRGGESPRGRNVAAKTADVRMSASSREFDYLIVGAGFAGSILAERLASQAGKRVLLVERRNHVAGNAHDHYDENGILVHRYGPHIFHTNATHVVDYLSMFTEWRPYQHRVLASVDGQLVPLPINLDTINLLYGTTLDAFEMKEFLRSVAEPVERVRTSEDVVVAAVGRELYEKFFRGYTRKQWGLDPSELEASVTARVPTRTNRDARYFTDRYQLMPLHGYTRMFERMLDHPNIKVLLNTDYREVLSFVPFGSMVYTGPIDEFFGYRFGRLPYRSLEFRFERLDQEWFQPAPVVNYPNDYAYTRCTEFKYLTGQRHPMTTVVYEYPREEGDPYYPVPAPANAGLYRTYRRAAEETPGVHFVGRLATYKYYNMDQVAAQALAVFERLEGRARLDRKDRSDDLDGAIIGSPAGVGRDRVHPEPGGRPVLRSAGA